MLTNEAASLKHEFTLLAEKNRELSEKVRLSLFAQLYIPYNYTDEVFESVK